MNERIHVFSYATNAIGLTTVNEKSSTLCCVSYSSIYYKSYYINNQDVGSSLSHSVS